MKNIRSAAKLEEMLEYIDLYWHRHGGEEREELENYIRALHAALPQDPAESANIRLPISTLTAHLNPALGHAGFLESEMKIQLREFLIELERLGAELTEDAVVLSGSIFEEGFDSYFDPELFSDDSATELARLRALILDRIHESGRVAA